MCRVLMVHPSGYYAWQHRSPSRRAQADQQLLVAIRQIYQQHKGRYGSPRICKQLQSQGYQVSQKQVARLMRQQGLSAVAKKHWVRTTNAKHSLPVADNLLHRHFSATAAGTKWVSDLTYLKTSHGWLYLCVIIDLWDRRVLGWSLATDLSSYHPVQALQMAVDNRKPQPGLIFHSDQGVQYCCAQFRQALQQYCPTVRQSMSRKGNCWDNACAESFFKTLKPELPQLDGRLSRQQTKLTVFEYIQAYYNRVRRHSSLGYQCPVALTASIA